MKRAILALLVASGCIGGEAKENCREYLTVLEDTFGENDGWKLDSSSCGSAFTSDCYSSPVCPGDSKEGYILSSMGRSVSKTFSVPADVAIDRLVLTGNSYGRDVSLEIKIEDFAETYLEDLNEEDDCRENVIDFHELRRGYVGNHAITGDGKLYLKISFFDLLGDYHPAPDMPRCHYFCNYSNTESKSDGYYGLSKIQFQQCVK